MAYVDQNYLTSYIKFTNKLFFNEYKKKNCIFSFKKKDTAMKLKGNVINMIVNVSERIFF